MFARDSKRMVEENKIMGQKQKLSQNEKNQHTPSITYKIPNQIPKYKIKSLTEKRNIKKRQAFTLGMISYGPGVGAKTSQFSKATTTTKLKTTYNIKTKVQKQKLFQIDENKHTHQV